MTVPTRWLLEGRLTTASALHVGSGAVTQRAGLVNEETGEPVEVSAVAVDHRERPYLPATALKGALRRRLRDMGVGREVLDPLLGHPPEEEEESRQRGGRGEVWDAPVAADAPGLDPEPPFWEPRRLTGVAPRVSIDRRTGAAAHQRLFHLEFVPAGVGFAVTVAGSLEEQEVVLLLTALEGFNDTEAPGGPLVLGAETVQGWGRLRWELEEIRRLEPEGVARWIEAGAPTAGYEALEPLPATERDALLQRVPAAGAGTGGGVGPEPPQAVLSLEIALDFEGPFLVNDPSRTGPGEDQPDHAPLRDDQGRAVLPATSFRGVLRSQAERILRTVRGSGGACGPGAERPPCRPPGSIEDVARLCPACRVFGAAGWRSPLAISDFRAADEGAEGRPFRQEFLAIDRFTGGGSEEWLGLEEGARGLKFNAQSVLGPTLRGRLDLDLRALARAGSEERPIAWALGLLALVLRDLAEGDLGFGWGSGKGYGRCEGRIVDFTLPPWEALPRRLRSDLQQVGLEGPAMLADPTVDLLDRESDLGFALEAAVLDLAEVPIDGDWAQASHPGGRSRGGGAP